MERCYAGAARREITPPLGKNLAGNPVDRPGPAERVDSPLYARVLAVGSGRAQALLIGLDVMAADRAFVSGLRREIAARHGLPAESVMVWAIHTHGGPAGLLRDLGGLDGPPDEPLLATLQEQVLGAVGEALDRLAPARIGVSQGEVTGVGANRRRPDGPMNPTATVLRVDHEDGAALAFLLHYTCHPTLGNFEHAYTADYPGYALAQLETAAPGAVGLFANGAAGDISTRFTRRALGNGEARRIGGLLAEGAGAIYRSIVPAPDLQVATAVEQTLLTLRPFPPAAALRAAEQQAAAAASAGRSRGLGPGEQRVLDINLVGARMARMFAEALPGDALPAEVQALAVDGLTLVGVPGELFVELGRMITGAVAGPAAVVGYANGYAGYLMDPAAAEQGGYEALTALVSPAEVLRLVELAKTAARRVAG